jgi:hypothetical protein
MWKPASTAAGERETGVYTADSVGSGATAPSQKRQATDRRSDSAASGRNERVAAACVAVRTAASTQSTTATFHSVTTPFSDPR